MEKCASRSRSSFVHPTVIFLNKGTARCHRSLPKIVLLHTYPFQRASQVTQKRVTIRVTSGSVFSDATTTERSQSFWAFHFSIVRPFNGGQATVLMPERIDSSFWGRREREGDRWDHLEIEWQFFRKQRPFLALLSHDWLYSEFGTVLCSTDLKKIERGNMSLRMVSNSQSCAYKSVYNRSRRVPASITWVWA